MTSAKKVDELGGDARSEHIVAEFDKNSRDAIRVMLGYFKGRRTISIREWYRIAAGELRPSKTGIDVDVSHLPALASAVQSALATARAEGLIPPPH
jgi:hypothetical protein